jgi:hypothetical protein
MRVRMSDLHLERAADLKNVVMVGQYGTWFAPTPDGSIEVPQDFFPEVTRFAEK